MLVHARMYEMVSPEATTFSHNARTAGTIKNTLKNNQKRIVLIENDTKLAIELAFAYDAGDTARRTHPRCAPAAGFAVPSVMVFSLPVPDSDHWGGFDFLVVRRRNFFMSTSRMILYLNTAKSARLRTESSLT